MGKQKFEAINKVGVEIWDVIDDSVTDDFGPQSDVELDDPLAVLGSGGEGTMGRVLRAVRASPIVETLERAEHENAQAVGRVIGHSFLEGFRWKMTVSFANGD